MSVISLVILFFDFRIEKNEDVNNKASNKRINLKVEYLICLLYLHSSHSIS